MRGEYILSTIKSSSFVELPPRARRIRIFERPKLALHGTTSACAENTLGFIGDDGVYRNYLRVRGEYHGFRASPLKNTELPPRARRILTSARCFNASTGTTSACAENTVHECCPIPCIRNYLRVRGEYSASKPTSRITMELPPRARRIHVFCPATTELFGTTSACAENTAAHLLSLYRIRNYLRVRGEYEPVSERSTALWELPPRARRIPE